MSKYNSRPGLKQVDNGTRKVAPTYGRAAFVTYVEKAGGTLVFDNDAERLVSHMLGFDPRVRRFRAQPFAVDLVEGRLLRTAEQRDAARRKYAGRKGASIYTPDFAAELTGGRQLVIEVKLDGFMGNAPDHERLALATEVLATYGHDVTRVVMPADTLHPLRSNVVLLHHAALRPELRPSERNIERTLELAELGVCTLAHYATGLGVSVNEIPAFIFHGVLSADLISHRIEGRMPMIPAYGGLDHLALTERLAQ